MNKIVKAYTRKGFVAFVTEAGNVFRLSTKGDRKVSVLAKLVEAGDSFIPAAIGAEHDFVAQGWAELDEHYGEPPPKPIAKKLVVPGKKNDIRLSVMYHIYGHVFFKVFGEDACYRVYCGSNLSKERIDLAVKHINEGHYNTHTWLECKRAFQRSWKKLVF
jgi:hypothetical protein